MKILFLTSRFPYPLEKGDKLRAFYQIKELSKYHEIHLISVVDEDIKPSWLEKLSEFTSSIYIVRITPLERFTSVVSAIFTHMPFQVSWFYSKSIERMIQEIIQNLKIDHCYCQLVRMAPYAIRLSIPKTIDYMDCFSESMQKRASIAGVLSSWIYKWEARRMQQFEASVFHLFDNQIIISDQDKSKMKFQEAQQIHVVSNGISKEFFDIKVESEKKYDIVFVGNMSYLPNVESVEYIVRNILPIFPKKLKFLIAGTNPDRRVLALKSDCVDVAGWMDDIRKAYLSGKVLVVPMWSGTGQQNKILEAMALGTPCLTTQPVNNAIGAKPDEEILIAESAVEFKQKLELLFADYLLYNKICTNGRNFVKQNYDWKQKGSILSSIFAQK